MPDEEGADENVHLGWKDYLALFIAFIQTVALPLLILVLIIVGLLVVLAALR